MSVGSEWYRKVYLIRLASVLTHFHVLSTWECVLITKVQLWECQADSKGWENSYLSGFGLACSLSSLNCRFVKIYPCFQNRLVYFQLIVALGELHGSLVIHWVNVSVTLFSEMLCRVKREQCDLIGTQGV